MITPAASPEFPRRFQGRVRSAERTTARCSTATAIETMKDARCGAVKCTMRLKPSPGIGTCRFFRKTNGRPTRMQFVAALAALLIGATPALAHEYTLGNLHQQTPDCGEPLANPCN